MVPLHFLHLCQFSSHVGVFHVNHTSKARVERGPGGTSSPKLPSKVVICTVSPLIFDFDPSTLRILGSQNLISKTLTLGLSWIKTNNFYFLKKYNLVLFAIFVVFQHGPVGYLI